MFPKAHLIRCFRFFVFLLRRIRFRNPQVVTLSSVLTQQPTRPKTDFSWSLRIRESSRITRSFKLNDSCVFTAINPTITRTIHSPQTIWRQTQKWQFGASMLVLLVFLPGKIRFLNFILLLKFYFKERKVVLFSFLI